MFNKTKNIYISFRCSIIALLFAFIFFTPYSQPLVAQETSVYTDIAFHFKQALEVLDQKKYNIARNKFERFINEYPHHNLSESNLLIADANYYIAYCGYKIQDSNTEELYLKYLNNFQGHAKNSAAFFDLGNYYFHQKEYKQSLKFYNKLNEKDLPKVTREEFIFKKSFANFSIKKFSQAKPGFKKLINSNSQYKNDASYYYGVIAYYEKKYNEALSNFLLVENHKKYGRVVPYYIAQINFVNEDYDEVISYGEPLLQRNKVVNNRVEISQLVGQSYFEKGNYIKAQEYLENYIKKAKSVSKEDYYQLGYTHYKNGNYKEAITNFKKLGHLKNTLAHNATFMLGESYLRIGDKENARNAFKQAASMNYDKSLKEDALFNAGKLAYELNHINDALTALKSFIEKYPQSKYTNEANELLAKVFLKTRNYNEAIKTIEGLKNPSSQVKKAYQKITYFQAIELYNSRKFTAAERSLNKSLKYPLSKNYEALAYYWKAEIQHIKKEYDLSIQYNNRFLQSKHHVSTEHNDKVNAILGHYLQGYNYYKRSEYKSAIIQFSKALNQPNIDYYPKLYADALLRAADCHFIQKEYASARNYYEKVIAGVFDGSDYAYYQKGILFGLDGDYNNKIDALKNMSRSFPKSIYADDAIYEIGNTYLAMENYPNAISQYKHLIKTFPKSELRPASKLKLGLIYFNQDNYNEALREYKSVVKNYPRTSSASEAMVAIKDVYIAKGDPDGYIRYLKSVPNANITYSEQDSIIYLSAENQFSNGNYQAALKGFNEYLLRFPNGYFSLPAHFYRGESYFSFEDFENAIKDYDFVLNSQQSLFTEKALFRAASINYYHTKNYKKSLEQYQLLKEAASIEENVSNSTLGIMRSAYKLNQYGLCMNYCDLIIEDDGFSEIQQTEALFKKSNSQYLINQKDKAMNGFRLVMNKINNEWAAESQYKIAQIQFDKGQLDAAEQSCFNFISNYPSYAQWLVRTYLLLSDIYIKRDNLLQAKATVQSILENYTEKDELRALAEEKYNQILAIETNRSKIKETETEIMEFQN